MKIIGRIFAVALISLAILFSVISMIPTSNGASTVYLSSSAHTETTITLSWTESQDRYFVNYTLYMSTNVNGPYREIWNTTDKAQTSYAVTGLNYSTNYYFYIVDYDAFGSARSNTLQANTTAPPVLNVNSVTQTTVSLGWNDFNTYSSLVPFVSYTVEMKSLTGGNWSTVQIIYSESSNSFTVTGLSPGSTYYFRIYDTVGISPNTFSTYSNTVTATTIPLLSVTISSGSTNTVTGQSVEIKALANGGYPPYTYTWFVNGNPVSGATGSEFYFNSTVPGTYNIYVSVKDSSGTTVNSNTIQVTVTSNSIFASGTFLLIIVLIIVILAVLLVLILFRKGKKRW